MSKPVEEIRSEVVLSKPCQYALRAMVFLVDQQAGKFQPIRVISERTSVPRPFLAKILNHLSHHDLVTARRGPRGGVRLSRPPEEVTIGEIVETIDPRDKSDECYLGLAQCNCRNPCPIHESWQKIRTEWKTVMHGRTLDDLSRFARGAPRRGA